MSLVWPSVEHPFVLTPAERGLDVQDAERICVPCYAAGRAGIYASISLVKELPAARPRGL